MQYVELKCEGGVVKTVDHGIIRPYPSETVYQPDLYDEQWRQDGEGQRNHQQQDHSSGASEPNVVVSHSADGRDGHGKSTKRSNSSNSNSNNSNNNNNNNNNNNPSSNANNNAISNSHHNTGRRKDHNRKRGGKKGANNNYSAAVAGGGSGIANGGGVGGGGSSDASSGKTINTNTYRSSRQR